jgi:hypothetical protein
LALLLAFAATLGPYLFHARRVMAGADRRIAAQILLRSLLDAPLNRSALADASRKGETNAGLQWWITAAPITIGAVAIAPRQKRLEREQNVSTPERPNWVPFRVIASVSWSPGQSISAETVRLGNMK